MCLLRGGDSEATAALATDSLLPYFLLMLAKLTSKNQLTLPKRVLDSVGVGSTPAFFEVEVEDGRIVLTPARVGGGDAVRLKLTELGITESDVVDAVAWARRGTPADRETE